MTDPAVDPASVTTGVRRAIDLSPIAPEEANRLETDELARLLALLEALPPEVWSAPVPDAPRNWDVKALVAQIAGGYAAQSSLQQLRRIANPRTLRFYHISGRSLRETVRQIHVGNRLYRTPEELIVELREAGERALRHRAIAFRPLAYFGQPGNRTAHSPEIPLGPFAAVRDLWFQRITIGTIAGWPPRLDVGHDDRIVEGLLLPGGAAADQALGDTAVDFAITGLSVPPLRFGAADSPAAELTIPPEPFALLASRRRSPAWARERATITGSVRAAMTVLTSIATNAARRPY